MAELVLVFRKEKDTKNTARFQEQPYDGTVGDPGNTNGDSPAIGTLYIQKSALDRLGLSDTVTVTLSKEI